MPETNRPLKVFLSYASQDKLLVRELSRRLVGEGWIDTWQDEKNLLPGQDWRVKIEEAVEEADVVIIVLSQHSVSKEGHVQKELRYAREIALEKPEDAIFLIPLRLDDCEVPRGLRFYQWVDYFDDKKDVSYKALVASLKLRYEQKLKVEKEGKLRKEQQERNAAERVAHEKVEKEAAEKARLKALEEERKRLAQERVERETVEKTTREKAAHENEKKETNTKEKRESTEKERLKDTPVFQEGKLIKSLKPKIEKPGNRKTNISSKTSVITAISIVGLVGVVCIALLGWAIAENFPPATATSTMDLSPALTSTSRPSPTMTLVYTPTSISTESPDFLNGSEILFAKKDGSIYSFENNTNTKIGLLAVPNEWNTRSKILGTYIWSWDASKNSFIVQGLATDQDVYFVNRSGQVISSLEVPYTSYCPNLSRDGKKIVVYSQAVTNGNIWVFNADGSGFIRLSLSATMRFGCPAWSPDGKMITAGASDSEGSYIVIMDLTGVVIKKFVMTEFFWFDSPKWSPDGKSLIICDQNEGIYKLDIENSDNLKILSSNVIDCDWSPDGNSVVFVTADGLNLLDMNTGVVISLLEIKDVVSVAWK